MIKIRVLFLAVFLFVCIPAFAQGQNEWVTFVEKDCGFSASFPGTPSPSTQSGKQTTTRIFSVDASPEYYAVRYTKYRDTITDKRGVAGWLDSMRTQIVTNSKGKLIAERSTDLNGWAGRELKIAVGESVLTTRIYWVKQQLFQVIASTPNPAQSKENIAKFFGAFSLKEKSYQSILMSPDKSNGMSSTLDVADRRIEMNPLEEFLINQKKSL